MKLKLYLLSRSGDIDYDTFDSCVVCAKNVNDAKSIHPNGDEFIEGKDDFSGSWAEYLSEISCIEIGTANKDTKRGVILASFIAG